MILPIAPRWIRFLLVAAVGASQLALSAEGEALADISSSIQFNYYADDARALQRDLLALKQLDVSDSEIILRQYYLAYGHMRLAEVLGSKDRSAASKAASHCVDLAEDVVDAESKRTTSRERARLDVLYAELWAIQAACDSFEADAAKRPGTSSSSNKARKRAATLAPSNPRVQLLAAIHQNRLAETTQEFSAAARTLLAVTQLFTNEQPDEFDLPDWGQADAWAWLGHSYLVLGDKVAARNAIEQALVLAPDYVWARALQSRLKSAR
jgi:hypothetical protein